MHLYSGPVGVSGAAAVMLTLSLLHGLTAAIGAETAPAELALSKEGLLPLLRAKDAEFDNIRFDYTVSGVHKARPFPAWKFPELAKEQGWENEKPEDIPFRYKETLVRRGPEVTCIRELDPSFKPPRETRRTMAPFQKWSNMGGLSREITKTGLTGRGHAILDILPGGLPVDIAQEQAMEIEFAHGYGFGKRIRTIDTLSREEGRWRVEGRIQIWWEDESTFNLVIDDDLLVREAVIESNVKGNLTRFEITTSGRVASEGFQVAETGSFKRIAAGAVRDGKVRGTPRVVKEFSTRFAAIKAHLNDEEYKTLTDITPEPGTQVNDRVAGITYFAGDELRDARSAVDATISQLGESTSSGPGPSEQDGDGRGRSALSGVSSQAPQQQRPLSAKARFGNSRPWAVPVSILVVVAVLATVLMAVFAKRRQSRGSE